MQSSLMLISHPLCPYVQRAAIVLEEKAVPFVRQDIDLGNKPGWFLEISPLGKTPVLRVGEEAIFESAVICEYLDETHGPRLHPAEALPRARHRAYMEFGSVVLNTIGRFYNAPDEESLAAAARDLRGQFARLEEKLLTGPYFAGASFTMVDAVFGPVFRYFDVIDTIGDFGIFDGLSKVSAWRHALGARPSVRQAVNGNYPQLLQTFLLARKSALTRLMKPASTGVGMHPTTHPSKHPPKHPSKHPARMEWS
jgi:glutathione S-transferase